MSSIIHGSTVDEKFASIEQTLQQFRRRLSTKVIGLLPPVPLIQSCVKPDVDGTIFRCVVPLHGKLVRTCVVAMEWPNSAFVVRLYHQSKEMDISVRLPSSAEMIAYPMDLDIFAGDVVRLAIEPSFGAASILVGLLVIPNPAGQTSQLPYLIEQFTKLEDKESASQGEEK